MSRLSLLSQKINKFVISNPEKQSRSLAPIRLQFTEVQSTKPIKGKTFEQSKSLGYKFFCYLFRKYGSRKGGGLMNHISFSL